MTKEQIIAIISIVVVFGGLMSTGSLKGFDVAPRAPEATREEAWSTFQSYIEAARVHDLEALSQLTGDLSVACQDPARIEECQRLMDTVYSIGRLFEKNAFRHTVVSGDEVSIYTDYVQEERFIISFVRDEEEKLRVTSIRMCLEGDEPLVECFDTEASQSGASDLSPNALLLEFYNQLFR